MHRRLHLNTTHSNSKNAYSLTSFFLKENLLVFITTDLDAFKIYLEIINIRRNEGEESCIQRFLGENLRKVHHLEDLNIDGTIILK